MNNAERALEFMDKIEAETGKQISDGLFDALVYMLDNPHADEPETDAQLAKHWEEIANALKRERDEARTAVGRLTKERDAEAARVVGANCKIDAGMDNNTQSDARRATAIQRIACLPFFTSND